jgi:hypothetical protein
MFCNKKETLYFLEHSEVYTERIVISQARMQAQLHHTYHFLTVAVTPCKGSSKLDVE